jgi:predicted secreted protein
MMRNQTAMILAASLLACGAAGCTGTAGKASASPTASSELREGVTWTDQEIMIALWENGSTGYAWTLSGMDQQTAVTLSSQETVDEGPTDAVGVPSLHEWILAPAAEGSADLEFTYARSFEKDKEPARTVTVEISVQSDLTFTVSFQDGNAGSTAQIANPFQDCSTLEEAASIAGFTFSAPDQVSGNAVSAIQAIDGRMIQVFYGDQTLLRKGNGTDDISGDYNEYDETAAVTISGLQVTERGKDGLVMCAVWTDGTYAYAIDAADQGLDASQIESLVSAMK